MSDTIDIQSDGTIKQSYLEVGTVQWSCGFPAEMTGSWVRRDTAERIDLMEIEIGELESKLDEAQDDLSDAEDRLSDTENDLEKLKRAVNAYLGHHREFSPAMHDLAKAVSE